MLCKLVWKYFQKKFFPQSEHVTSQIWCQKFFPLLGGGGGGGSLNKKFFSGLNMYQAKSGVKNFSLYWDWVPPPPNLRPGTPPWKSETWDPTPWKSETWGPPPKIWDLGPPPRKSETWDPPRKSETWDPPPVRGWIGYPPPPKCEQTETITFPYPSDGGR